MNKIQQLVATFSNQISGQNSNPNQELLAQVEANYNELAKLKGLMKQIKDLEKQNRNYRIVTQNLPSHVDYKIYFENGEVITMGATQIPVA